MVCGGCLRALYSCLMLGGRLLIVLVMWREARGGREARARLQGWNCSWLQAAPFSILSAPPGHAIRAWHRSVPGRRPPWAPPHRPSPTSLAGSSSWCARCARGGSSGRRRRRSPTRTSSGRTMVRAEREGVGGGLLVVRADQASQLPVLTGPGSVSVRWLPAGESTACYPSTTVVGSPHHAAVTDCMLLTTHPTRTLPRQARRWTRLPPASLTSRPPSSSCPATRRATTRRPSTCPLRQAPRACRCAARPPAVPFALPTVTFTSLPSTERDCEGCGEPAECCAHGTKTA